MKPMQSMCKLLYAVFDLSTLTTRNIENLLNASFDTHDMKPMQSMCKLLYAVFDLRHSWQET